MHPTITCDAWSDKYQHRSYFCITIHFLDSNLTLHRYSLNTQPFNDVHTGENIKDLVSKVLFDYGINPSNVIVVSDKGSNMRKAWKMLNVVHIYCIAHGLHNLLMTDCFPKLQHVSEILNKVQTIINKLRYRQHELETEYFKSTDKEFNDLFLSINKVGEIIDADLAVTCIDDEDDMNVFNEISRIDNTDYAYLSDELEHKQKINENKYKVNSSLTIKDYNDSNRFHTLQKRVVTRWNTILIMLRSYYDNIRGVEAILSRLKSFELILSTAENQVICDLIEFLSIFESTTTILSGSKSYPTISLCLLLRMEIESIIQIDGTEPSIIQELKFLLLENLENRFPVTPLYICAFLLDPSQLKIEISRYLSRCQTTKELILCEMINKFKINCDAHASTNNVTSDSSSSTATKDTSSSTTTVIPLKRQLSVESLSSPKKNLKRLREDLILKHKPTSSSSFDPILNEVQNYLKLDIICDDVLEFWKTSGDAFPHMKKLARIILAVPSTSTPSEEVFSTTGLILNAKRTMLLPENVAKIQIIHDNYNLLKNI